MIRIYALFATIFSFYLLYTSFLFISIFICFYSVILFFLYSPLDSFLDSRFITNLLLNEKNKTVIGRKRLPYL